MRSTCNTLQHTATHCNTLQHTATHCNTLQHTATYVTVLIFQRRSVLLDTATHYNTLQHSAPRYITLQHTATHCNTLQLTAICPFLITTFMSVFWFIRNVTFLLLRFIILLTRYSWMVFWFTCMKVFWYVSILCSSVSLFP